MVAACSSTTNNAPDSGTATDASDDAPTSDASGSDVTPPQCTTRIQYGSTWIHGTSHPADFDVTAGAVTWDGSCTDDGPNSYATLSNGWKPYFAGSSSCVMALDETNCAGAPTSCTTRVTYGAGWLAPSGHTATYDDVTGRVFSDEVCHGGTYADLSNGWQPHFSAGSCPLSFRYEQCGGLYDNPVIPGDCPDPGVLRDGSTYVLTCTSGNAADAFPIYTSPDLATWALTSHVFPSGKHPTWAASDFWAPEIHHVGTHYVVYFTSRGTDGVLAVGAATSASATGPFTDLGAPLIHDSAMGLIDPSEITSSAGTPYVLWKEDGNAVGKPTPIHAQQLSADGTSLTGSAATLITNDESWEGAVTEAPFMVERSGTFYLFYSGGSYANATYAVGVARGSSPMGPMSKLGAPILVTGGAWVGPGHCTVLDTPAGDTAIIYHAWQAGCVNGPGCGRETLVDTIGWQTSGWPSVELGPSSNSRPLL